MSQLEFRDALMKRLRDDLLGPLEPSEEISDRPTDRYMTGILYPQMSFPRADEDDDFTAGDDGDQEDTEKDQVPLISTIKPASCGLSFCVAHGPAVNPEVQVRISGGTYKKFSVDDVGKETTTTKPKRSAVRWKRTDHRMELAALSLGLGSHKRDLSADGFEGLELHTQVTEWAKDRVLVTLALANRHEMGESRDASEELTYFQVQLEIEPAAGTQLVTRPSRKTTLDEDDRAADLIYRDAKEIAVGHTCAAEWDDNKDGTVSAARTTWLPMASVPAMSAKGDKEAFAKLHDTTGLKPLSANWLAVANKEDLKQALTLLVTLYRDWIRAEGTRISGLEVRLQSQASKHLQICDDTADRMQGSVELIDSDEPTRRAFQLAQQAMATQRKWTYSGEPQLSWYPFQIGFQLLSIESLANRDHHDRKVMDLLWFPTGGGKTEAYLGLTAFILFLRRLRSSPIDSGAGVAVIMRYTLRLLTIQQFQRAATLVTVCEHLRRKRRDEGDVSLGTTPFSVGLWVGNSATPKTIADARKLKMDSPSTHKQLTKCPCCQGSVVWSLTTNRRVACAGDNDCELAKLDATLPIWTIDEDVYREAPSLVIGTVDKFAQIVRNPHTGALFATNSDNTPPDLIIQDELHLISGPLGSVTGLYEAAIDELCASKGTRPKIIGSTATIRRAAAQGLALFNRETQQFPPPALDASNSCFAVVDNERPGRTYVGVTTAGRSAKFAVQAISATLLQAASMGGFSVADSDPYWTLVGYFNTLRELGGSLVLMQDDVPIGMEQLRLRHDEPLRKIDPPAELTGRVSSSELGAMLNEVSKKRGEDGCFDVVLASSMLSVGVDIPRLGLMMMVGQPKTFAEYIQATSRVGRGSVPGLVVSLYNAGRIRDRAHFEGFSTWHQALYREVEATSVTPFASRAQDKALHAVLVALVRHLVPGMLKKPKLSADARSQAQELAGRIAARVKDIDGVEYAGVVELLNQKLEEWAEAEVKEYWDDSGKTSSLLMSAEQAAAGKASGTSRARALWPTPNSMREVEPSSPFILVPALKAED